ncbi:MAG TPA: substrate-binding domain-containing protein [Polyangiaceae bacterium]
MPSRSRSTRSYVAPSAEGARAELLGTNEVARLLDVHPKHVYRLLRRGLPAHRLGGEWRYDEREVLAWVRGGAEGESPGSRPQATSEPASAPPLLAANGDICVEILLQLTREVTGLTVGFVAADRSSGRALLARGAVAAAGVHSEDAPRGALGRVQVHVTRRELCLAFPRGKRIRKLQDCVGLRLATRAPSAGVRARFDAAVLAEELDPARFESKAIVHESHRDVILAVLSGSADVALTTAAWAQRAGLASLPFAEEDYSLELTALELTRPSGRALVQALQNREIRKSLSAVAGYDPRNAGALRL